MCTLYGAIAQQLGGVFEPAWSVPSPGGYLFWGVSVFTGCGESLLEFDQAVTRAMLGEMLWR